jgi:hypothetical protein
MSKGYVRPNGYACAKPSNPCLYESACDGFKSECELSKKPDGIACPAGACIMGKCIVGVDPSDDNTYHEIHVHHDVAAGEDLVKVVTTRKLDGTKIVKEFTISAVEEEREKKSAEKVATKAHKEEEKKLEKAQLNTPAPAASNIKITHSDSPYTEVHMDQATRLARLNHAKNPLLIQHLTDLSEEPTFAQCVKGLCCNTTSHHFSKYGEPCGRSKNPCAMKVCSGNDAMCHTVNTPDGEVCPGGLCFEGACVKNCVGPCCDSNGNSLSDGTKCGADGWCFNGICARNCTGDCCEPFHNFAKPDGAPCMRGVCQAGVCQEAEQTQTQTQTQTTPSLTNALPSSLTPSSTPSIPTNFDMQNIIPLTSSEHHAPKKDEELEKMWAKLIQDENKEKEARRAAKEAAKSTNTYTPTTSYASLQASASNLASSASNASKTGLSTTSKIILIAGSSVGLIIIVAIVAVVVSSKKKKNAETQKKRQDQETEYYYEKF